MEQRGRQVGPAPLSSVPGANPKLSRKVPGQDQGHAPSTHTHLHPAEAFSDIKVRSKGRNRNRGRRRAGGPEPTGEGAPVSTKRLRLHPPGWTEGPCLFTLVKYKDVTRRGWLRSGRPGPRCSRKLTCSTQPSPHRKHLRPGRLPQEDKHTRFLSRWNSAGFGPRLPGQLLDHLAP